jgi:hypothetical protein
LILLEGSLQSVVINEAVIEQDPTVAQIVSIEVNAERREDVSREDNLPRALPGKVRGSRRYSVGRDLLQ